MALREFSTRIRFSRSLFAVFVSSFLLVCLVHQAEANSASTRAALQKRYDAWAAAYLKKDAAALVAMLSPDFTLKTGSGRMLTRRQYEAMLRKRSPGAVVVTAYATRIKRVEVSADGKKATVYTTETTTEKAPPAPQAKKLVARSTTTHVHEYRDEWVRSRCLWLLRSSETLEEGSH